REILPDKTYSCFVAMIGKLVDPATFAFEPNALVEPKKSSEDEIKTYSCFLVWTRPTCCSRFAAVDSLALLGSPQLFPALRLLLLSHSPPVLLSPFSVSRLFVFRLYF